MLSSLSTVIARTILRQNSPFNGSFIPMLGGASVEITQTRGRKRGRRNLSNAEKLKRKEAKEARLATKKTFEQKLILSKIKKAKVAIDWPPRYDADAESSIKEPLFNVCLANEMKTRFYPLAEAMEKHRHFASIHGNEDGILKMHLELNMSTEKAAKLIGASRQIVSIPYPFEHKEMRTILAFVPNKEVEEEALKAGADLALSNDAIKKILRGKFLIDDYDFCVAHEDMAHEILPLRGVLKTRFPTKINGAIGPDITALLTKFLAGVNLKIKPNLANQQHGTCDLLIGRLNMPVEHVEENLKTVLSFIFPMRNPALGPFINRAALLVPPSKTFFSVEISQWEPVPTETDEKKIQKKKKKKEEKKIGQEGQFGSTEYDAIMGKWESDPLYSIM